MNIGYCMIVNPFPKGSEITVLIYFPNTSHLCQSCVIFPKAMHA